MSGLAAIFSQSGPGIARDDIERMTTLMAGRGGVPATWHMPLVALGCHLRASTPEDLSGAQPVADASTGRAIVFDGRIDNRDDVAAISGRRAARLSDALLALHAFDAGGLAAFDRIEGDFALVIWDAVRRELVCTRDLFGMRPLFYAQLDGVFAAASELQAVVGRRACEPNTGMVAEALTGLITSRSETLLSGVFRVLPGHAVVVDAERTRSIEWASSPAPRPLRYRDEREYQLHFRALLASATRDRLRASGSVGVLLSGGVDSSSVYVSARAASTAVGAYTICFSGAHDESGVAAETVRRHGGRLHTTGPCAHEHDYAAEIARYRDLPTYPTGANSTAIRRLAASHGVTTLLSGVGGDEWFFGNPGRWTDALVAGRWSRLWREWQAARDGDDPTSWKELVTTTVRPLTPRPLRKAIHRAMHGPMPFPWLSEDFVRASDVHERLRQPPVRARGSFAARGMLQAVRCGASLFAYEDLERLAARCGTDERLPYFDRRIVEFALSIPEQIRTRPRRSKWITREAFRSELPDAVVNPPEPPDYTFLIVDALEAMGGALRLADLEIARLGWVNGDLVAAMATRCLSTARTSREHLGDAWRLWSVLAVDEWYRRALPARADTDHRALPLRVRFG